MDTLLADFASGVDLLLFLTASAAIFTGTLVQGATGIGLGMIAAPILLFIDPRFVPGPLLVLALAVSILIAYRERHAIDFSGLTYALVGRVPGTIVAGLTIAAIPLQLFGLVFGVMVLLAVALSAGRWVVLPSKRNLVVAGFASGYMGTLTSIGAPPIAIAYQRAEAPRIRSTLAVFFVIGAAFSILTLAWFGKFTLEQLVISLAFLPALLAGFWASRWVVMWTTGPWTRYAVLIISGLSAAILIFKSVGATGG